MELLGIEPTTPCSEIPGKGTFGASTTGVEIGMRGPDGGSGERFVRFLGEHPGAMAELLAVISTRASICPQPVAQAQLASLCRTRATPARRRIRETIEDQIERTAGP